MDIVQEQPAPVAEHSPSVDSSIRIQPSTDPKLGRIWIITAVQTLPRPVSEIFPFFADAYNLEKLTPSFLNFRVLTPKPIDIRTGCIIDYTLRVHRVPLKWKTEILDWDPPRAFCDNQAKGPYTRWHHTHSFEPINDGLATRCTDTVRYRPKGWILAPLINKFFVQKDVENIFRYRFEKLNEFFPPLASQGSGNSQSL